MTGADAAGVLPAFDGVAVHDAWAPYDCYDQATDALCGAHVLRELQAVTETAPTGGQWAARLAECLRTLKHATDDAREHGRAGLDPVWLAAQVRAYTAAATVGFNVSSARSNEVDKKHKGAALLRLSTGRVFRHLGSVMCGCVGVPGSGASPSIGRSRRC